MGDGDNSHRPLVDRSGRFRYLVFLVAVFSRTSFVDEPPVPITLSRTLHLIVVDRSRDVKLGNPSVSRHQGYAHGQVVARVSYSSMARALGQ